MTYPTFANLEHTYIISRWIYGCMMNSQDDKEIEPPLSDTEYGFVHRYMVSQGLLPEYTGRTWSEDPCPVDLLTRYGLTQFIYNIVLTGKTESIPSITDETEVERFYKGRDGQIFLLSFKIDGWNMQVTYYNGEIAHIQTRGRESEAIDVTHLKDRLPKRIPRMGEVKIVVEMCVHDADFEELKRRFPLKDLISQRASVRTAAAHAPDLLSFLAYNIIVEGNEEMSATHKYATLQSWGFKTPDYKVVNSYDGIIATVKEFSERRKTYPYLTDGVVVRTDVGEELRAIRIMAWAEEIYTSYIESYEYTEGPVYESVKLLIRPVLLDNSRHRRLPATNESRIKKYKWYPGTPVAFKLVSSASPQIDIEMTKLLQEQYKNQLEAYKQDIEIREKTKLIMRYGNDAVDDLLRNGIIFDFELEE